MAMIHVMHCREIAALIDAEAVANLSWIARMQFRVHLWVCWHCRQLKRQVRWLGRITRQAINAIPSADADFELRILSRLSLPPK